ncbi:MAG: kelch repeat-containing protein [Acidimicrobiales bacterium]
MRARGWRAIGTVVAAALVLVPLAAPAPAGAALPAGTKVVTTPVPPPLPPGDLADTAASVAGTGDGSSVVYFAGDEAETWTYSPAANSWTKRTPAQTPPARQGAAAGGVAGGGPKTVLYGGFQTAGNVFLADTWVFDAAAGQWTQRCTSCAPGGLARAMVAAGPTDTLLFGGSKFFGFVDALWRWDDATGDWAQVTPAGPNGFPQSRGDAMFAWDGSAFVLYGGLGDSFASMADTWRLVPTGGGQYRWDPICASCAPGPRSLAAMSTFGGGATPAGALLVGGRHLDPNLPAALTYADGWFWQPSDSSWNQVIAGPAPTPLPDEPGVPYAPTMGSFPARGAASVVLTDTHFIERQAAVESNVLAWFQASPTTSSTTTTSILPTTSTTLAGTTTVTPAFTG